jgi:hypothetical protein
MKVEKTGALKGSLGGSSSTGKLGAAPDKFTKPKTLVCYVW